MRLIKYKTSCIIFLSCELSWKTANYSRDVAAYTSSIETILVLLNVAASEDAYIMTAGIKDFYVATSLAGQNIVWATLKTIEIHICIIN